MVHVGMADADGLKRKELPGSEALEMTAVEEQGLAFIEYPDIDNWIEQGPVHQTGEKRGSHGNSYATKR